MINKKIIGVTSVNLGDISDPFEELSDATKLSWRHLIFFRIRTMIKHEYFDQFLEIEEDWIKHGIILKSKISPTDQLFGAITLYI